jgi:hypothetical protein
VIVTVGLESLALLNGRFSSWPISAMDSAHLTSDVMLALPEPRSLQLLPAFPADDAKASIEKLFGALLPTAV